MNYFPITAQHEVFCSMQCSERSFLRSEFRLGLAVQSIFSSLHSLDTHFPRVRINVIVLNLKLSAFRRRASDEYSTSLFYDLWLCVLIEITHFFESFFCTRHQDLIMNHSGVQFWTRKSKSRWKKSVPLQCTWETKWQWWIFVSFIKRKILKNAQCEDIHPHHNRAWM